MATTTTLGTGRMGRMSLLAGAALMALGALFAVTGPAAARHGADDGGNGAAADVEREKHGDCTRSSDWELELEKEHGRIEVKVDLDTNRSRRQWRVRIWHDGRLTSSVLRRSQRDGDVEVQRTRSDHRGRDVFRFRAVDQVNGEVCRGSLSI